jgi:hypothetical protein
MADVRTARRNAEKAARDALAGTLVGAAGELGVARATQQEAGAGVEAAAERGRQLLEAAQLEAAALLDRAQAQVAEADTGYASAWQNARDAGWTPAQLRGWVMPFLRPPHRPGVAPPSNTAQQRARPPLLRWHPDGAAVRGRWPRVEGTRALSRYTVTTGALVCANHALPYGCW